MSAPSASSSDLRARIAVSAVFFMDGAVLGGWMPHIATVRQTLHLSDGLLGASLLGSAVGGVVAMPFGGLLIHRFGSRNVSCFLAWLLCLAVPFLVVMPSLPSFVMVLFVVGASNGLVDVSMNAHSVQVQRRFERPILSAVHGWFSLGGFMGGAFASVAAALGLSPGVHLAIASVVLAFLPAVGLLWMLPADVDKHAEGPAFAVPKGILLLLGVLITFSFLSEGAVWEWAGVYLRFEMKAVAQVAAMGFCLASGGMALARFFGDAVIHRWGSQAVLRLSALLASLGIFGAVTVPSTPLSIAGFAVAGVGLANVIPILFRASANQPGIPAATGLAAVTTCGYCAFLAGPPSIGAIADVRGLGFSLGLVAVLLLSVAAFGPLAAGVLAKGKEESLETW